ncbi:26S proteasome non-ATPase regulatory subunit 10-like isoform X2 [Bacillus rossius redtenbacheri]|uniref:26S proteasome non-ATPase regulatory subunit 10-like isoform X2 n=1 Tax=Bacillus rossius redtenbacheri TaxID=93214 RepID=UPI002FDD03A2
MPLTRPVFGPPEKSCEGGLILEQLLCMVKAMDGKLDSIKAECEALRTQVEETSTKVGAVGSDVIKLAAEQQELRRQVERLSDVEQERASSRRLDTAGATSLRSEGLDEISGSGVSTAKIKVVGDLVRQYCGSGDWQQLRRGLLAVLDEGCVAHGQLLATPSLYGIGLGGHEQLARLLLCAGLPVDHAAGDGFTLLHGAAEAGHADLARYLLTRGANVEARTGLGSTPLVFAASANRPQVAELLLRAGANVNARDHDGATSLHRAARRGHMQVVQVLLRTGADVAVKDNVGRTALDMAREGGHFPVVQILSPLPPLPLSFVTGTL